MIPITKPPFWGVTSPRGRQKLFPDPWGIFLSGNVEDFDSDKKTIKDV